ncbi:hypothetical protein ALPR1_14009 [Algoriphagus machipongonensis]|uniref:Lipoprotein n=2 Tax=Algoriphagus machipongonensis TaxID=388413 RepID=A3I2Z2_9BACT|nr:hypothetical protein ALPR1_14009 [Algoriphagus machipongonensis]
MKMKTKSTLLIGGAILVSAFACETKQYSEQDKKEVTSSLQSYVDSVETAVQIIPVHNWTVIEERYDSLDSHAEKVYEDLNVDDQEIETIEDRYEKIVENGKNEQQVFEEKADMHMKNVETWWNKTSENIETGTKNTIEDVEDATQESLTWLEKNFEKLSKESQEKYDEIRKSLEKD